MDLSTDQNFWSTKYLTRDNGRYCHGNRKVSGPNPGKDVTDKQFLHRWRSAPLGVSVTVALIYELGNLLLPFQKKKKFLHMKTLTGFCKLVEAKPVWICAWPSSLVRNK